MGLIDLLTDLNNRRHVRSQARKCRSHGATDEMIGHVLTSVREVAVTLGADDDPSDAYLKMRFKSLMESRMPGLDPATILLLVQLAVMIYQALKAVGFLDREGLSAVTPATIEEHFGGL